MADTADPVVHLHTHTEHSLLDGLSRVDELVSEIADQWEPVAGRAEQHGLDRPTVAITDHGTLSGAWKFQNAADKAGVKAVMGTEFYVAHGNRFERREIEVAREDGDMDPDSKRPGKSATKTSRYNHLTVVAESTVGWQNLVRLNNLAHDPDAYWFKPRVDLDLLADNADGLIVFTGCLGGPVASRLLRGDIEGAERVLVDMAERFGGTSDPETSGLFVEIMSHGIAVEDERVRPELIRLARKHGLPIVATNDSHYVKPGHRGHHDAWLCVGTHSKVADTDRYGFDGDGFHLRTAVELRELFSVEGVGEACDNTLVIARRTAERVLPEPGMYLPSFPIPADYTPSEAATKQGYTGQTALLYDRVLEGARRRYGTPFSATVKERLRHEFDVIVSKGYPAYFLIVQDVVDWARSRGIGVGPGRGSAAGCAVSYCLGIVGVDPIANGLLFERFLNPDRVTMPDIDLDFEAARRIEVIHYLRERWGVDNVARIGTFGMARTKKAIRDAARVLDVSHVGDRLARQVGTKKSGKPYTPDELLDVGNAETASFREAVEASGDDGSAVVDMARAFEGVISTAGIHACGILIADEALTSLVPTRRDRSSGANHIEGMLVTEWDGSDVDDFGLLKLDVLGLLNLDIISRCVANVSDDLGVDISEVVESPPTSMDDALARNAWDMLQAGRTVGVFQLEGDGMTRLCVDMRPDSLDDLAALVALFRPGPLGQNMHERYVERKHGREPIDYTIFTKGSPAAEAEEEVVAQVLGVTYGTPVFQEQLMQLGEVVAGFGPSLRNRLQKAVSKKIHSEMEAVGQAFIDGATSDVHADGSAGKLVFAESTARRLWDAIKSAGDYAFNRSHSYGYGFLAWITAVLKANWPAHYAAAVLATIDDNDKRQASLEAFRSEGVTVRGPDVNRSRTFTTVEGDGVRLGLSEIRNVGVAGEWIVVERERNGEFLDLRDLASRVTEPASDRHVQAPMVADLLNRVAAVCGHRPSPTRAAKVPTLARLGAKPVEALISSGAADSLIPGGRASRRGALVVSRTANVDGNGAPEFRVPSMSWSSLETAFRESHMLGLVIGDHPLAGVDASTFDADACHLGEMGGGDGEVVSVLAQIAAWAESTYSGGRMAKMLLTGPGAVTNAIMWDRDLAKLRKGGGVPVPGQVAVVRGRVSIRQDVSARPDPDEGNEDDGVEDNAGEETRELTVFSVDPVTLPSDDSAFAGEGFVLRRPPGLSGTGQQGLFGTV